MSNESFSPNGLNDLISKNDQAKSYFISLPDYVQGMIRQRSGNVHNMDELKRYAENLLAGDR